jgi:hypothetical protein
LTKRAAIADRCRLQAIAEVACEFIADYVVPQMIIRSPRVQPGKLLLVDTKRLLQHYLPLPDGGARFGSRTASGFEWRAPQRDRKLPQDHPGRPIIVRCITTVPTRRIALTPDARPECPITTRARFLLTGTTVTIMARNLRRERR